MNINICSQLKSDHWLVKVAHTMLKSIKEIEQLSVLIQNLTKEMKLRKTKQERESLSKKDCVCGLCGSAIKKGDSVVITPAASSEDGNILIQCRKCKPRKKENVQDPSKEVGGLVVYIAGPITDLKKEKGYEYVEKIFQEAEDYIVQLGNYPINPLKLDHNHDKKWVSYMKECIPHVCSADQVYMISGWTGSKGAKIEYDLAKALKIPVVFQLPEHKVLD